ncbi:hypothetical protein X727_31265 [Mesorhizobium sp. L103C119B0]|nr:hypothetical protein X727_31265 [Mesorhizobium sp. L103C119B0]
MKLVIRKIPEALIWQNNIAIKSYLRVFYI